MIMRHYSNDLFDLLARDLFRAFPESHPVSNLKLPVDVYREEDSGTFVFEFGASGAKREDFKVTTDSDGDGDYLVVERKERSEENTKRVYLVAKLAKRAFKQSFAFPKYRYDLAKITAALEDGILRVSVPKAEDTRKEVKIDVNIK